MDKIIDTYEMELVEAGCAPGSGRYGALLKLKNDISPVMPYLNAVLDESRYDHDNHILILRESDRAYALRSDEIRIARADDWHQAQELAVEIVDRINSTWQKRESITPRITERKIPTVIDIFKLLPKTNCKECGYTTCLAFAADIVQGTVFLENCPAISSQTQKEILTLFED